VALDLDTALVLIELLAGDSDRSDNTTAAAIYHTLYQRPGCTLLIDEGDNLGIFENNTIRSLFNGGYQRGGKIKRFIGGRPREFSTFAPLAIGAIGTLPQPLLSRSIIVHMQRYAPGEYQIRRLDEVHPDPAFAAAREEVLRWAATCVLNPDPDMPANFNRPADRWRVLLAIADNLGHGEDARAAAQVLNAGGFLMNRGAPPDRYPVGVRRARCRSRQKRGAGRGATENRRQLME
jgi:Protein of unknown function (DUF3631)